VGVCVVAVVTGGWSSGQLLDEYVATDQCDHCLYEGRVDKWFDPELGRGGFACPSCTTENHRYPEGN